MIASVQFSNFWPVENFENLRATFQILRNAFFVTSKKCHWSAVILMVFKIVKKRLYQEHVFNNDDSNSYFVKNQVLEPDMKSANLDSLVNYKTRKLQNAQILTIFKFNERVPYHERLQVSKFPIFGQLEFLKICAAFLNFAQTRFL